MWDIRRDIIQECRLLIKRVGSARRARPGRNARPEHGDSGHVVLGFGPEQAWKLPVLVPNLLDDYRHAEQEHERQSTPGPEHERGAQ